MKKIIAWIMFFIQALCVFSLPAYADADNTSGSAEEILEIIVKYKPGRSPDAAYFADDENNISNGSENTESEPLLVQLSSEEEAKAVLAELQQDENIEYAEPNYKLYADAVSTDPLFDKQWGLENVGQTVEGVEGTAGIDIRAKEALRETYFDNGGVTVAVIDGGIDLNHPDLKDNIFVNTGEIAGDKRDNDGNGCDDDVNGWDFVEVTNQPTNDDENDVHGTHVAGIIAAALNGEGVQGVAPHAKILPLKIMKNSVGTVYNAIQAIDYAEKMGAQIANCSWSLPNYSAALEYAMEHSNILFVCSAGNNGNNLAQEERYPASFGLPNVISVAFTDNRGELHEMSNYGKNVDIAAPGVSIYSTVPVIAGSEENGVAERKYAYLSGSSMAAPFVAGAVALIKGHENNLSAIDVKKKIMESATKMNALSGKVSCGGMLNAAAALKQPTFSGDARHTAYYGAAAETVGNSIYRIGGYNSKCTSSVSRYDASNKSWGYAASMKGARANHSSVVVSDKIYVFGGENNGKTLSTAEVYDAQADTWTSLSEMPKGIKGAAISAVGNKIYLFGGVSDKKFVSTIYIYDTESDSWTAKGSLPQECAFVSAVALDNQSVYLFGGVNNSGCLKSVLCYNVSSGTFSEKADMAEFKHSAFALKMQDKIYVIGGNNDVPKNGEDRVINGSGAVASVLTAAYEYDPAQDTWSPLVDLNVLSFGGAPVYHNNAVYYIGGLYGSDFASVEHYRGFDVPQNIRAIMQDDKIELSWNEVSGATHYYVEKDGVVLDRQTTVNAKFDYVSGTVHSFRVRAEKDGKKFAWSKVVTNNEKEQMEDALVTDGGNYFRTFRDDTDVHWYKIKINEPRSLSLRIENIPSGNKYQAALCDFSGNVLTYGREEDGKIIIDKFSLEPYTYYVKVFQLSCDNADRSYKLNLQLDPEVSSLLPQRIFADLLKPANATVESSGIKLNRLEDFPNADFSFGKETETAEKVSLPINDNSDYDQKFPYIKDLLRESAEKRAAAIAEQALVEPDAVTNEVDDGKPKWGVFEYDNFTERHTSNDLEHEISLPVSSFIRFLQDNQNLTGKIVVSLKSLSGTDSFYCAVARDDEFQSDEYFILGHEFSEHGSNAKSLSVLVAGNQKSVKPYFGLNVHCKGTYEIKVTLLYTEKTLEDYTNLNDKISDFPDDLSPIVNFKNNPLNFFQQQGAIDHAMDVDFYKVYLQKGDKFSAYVETPNTVRTGYGVSIFNEEEQEISCAWKTEESKNMSTEMIVPESGIYYVSVFPSKIHTAANQLDAYDENFSCWYRYNLYLFRSNSNEHEYFEINDRFDMANEHEYKNNYIGSHLYVSNAIANCTIDSMGDKDIYPVELNAGDKLSVQLTDKSNNEGNFKISIIDNLYKEISDNAPGILRFDRSTYDNPPNENNKNTKFVTFIAPETKTYYVQVHSYKNVKYASVTGKYDLIITHVPAEELDVFENRTLNSNDFRGNLARLKNDDGEETDVLEYLDSSVLLTGNKYTGLTLDNQLDVDWYRVEVPNNGTGSDNNTVVTATPIGVDFDNICLTVQDAFGKVISTKNGNSWMAQPGSTYYISVTRKDGVKDLPAKIGYTLELSGLGSYISPLVYNNGYGVKSGTNKLAFDLGRLDSNANYKYIVKLGWGSGDLYTKYQREVTASQQGGIAQSVDIDINKCGSGLRTVVELYKDNALIFSTERTDVVTNNLIQFEKTNNCSYIFTNNPEQITTADLADSDKGNTTILTERGKDGTGLSGDVTVHMSHQSTNLKMYYDVLIEAENPNIPVTIKVNRIGWQVADYNFDKIEKKSFSTILGWADYLGIDLDQKMYLKHPYSDIMQSRPAAYYTDIKDKEFVINANKPKRLLLGESELHNLPHTDEINWQMLDLVIDFTISGGKAYVSPIIYQEIDKVNEPLPGNLISYRGNTEADVGQKIKGTSYEGSEVVCDLYFTLDDSYQDGEWLELDVPNIRYPEGAATIGQGSAFLPQTYRQWYTHFNPLSAGTDYNFPGVKNDFLNRGCGESDIVTFLYNSDNLNWSFSPYKTTLRYWYDNNYSDSAKNVSVSSGEIDDLPNVKFNSLANYGVMTKYNIAFNNIGKYNKTVNYILDTHSSIFILYKLNNERQYHTLLKLPIESKSEDGEKSFEQLLNDGIASRAISIDVPANTEQKLELIIILPNGDAGGLRNILEVKTTGQEEN